MKKKALAGTGKRPALQLYVMDWLNDPALRFCSLSARGLWMDMLCLMHQATPYGHLFMAGRPMGASELARVLGRNRKEVSKLLGELHASQVFSFASVDAARPGWSSVQVRMVAGSLAIVSGFSGDESAIDPGSSPDSWCIFSRRMVRDEYVRLKRVEAGSKGGNPALLRGSGAPPPGALDNQRVKRVDNGAPNHTDKPTHNPSSSSPSSSSSLTGSESSTSSRPINPIGQANDAGAEYPGEADDPDAGEQGVLADELDLSCPHEALIALYEELLPMLPSVMRGKWANGPGARSLACRWEEGLSGKLPEWMSYASRTEGLDAWRAFFERVAVSDFLTGRNGRWRGASLRWLAKSENFVKILEGNYLDSQYTRRSPMLDAFMASYPRAGADPVGVALAWNTMGLEGEAARILQALAKWSQSEQWQADGGRYVPCAKRWLRSRAFDHLPEQAAPAAPAGRRSNVHPLPARATGSRNALWAEPTKGSRHPTQTGDWRAIKFPGGLYCLSEDALVLDEDITSAPALMEPFYAHGRIAAVERPPERVRLMLASYLRGQFVKPEVPLREEELPIFPDDAMEDLECRMEEFG